MMMTTTSKLHASLIWAGEPIADVVLARPGSITIGPVAGATFTTPDLGLPEVFPIVSAAESGYVVTLGHAMAGTVSLGGVRTDVGELVAGSPFAAAGLLPGDWGVVDLDAGGELQLFFQVAPAPARIAPGRLELDTILPAAAFSVLLHVFLLIASYRVAIAESPFTWPGTRSVTSTYLVRRIEAVPTPPPVRQVVAMVPVGPKQPSEPEAATQIKPPKLRLDPKPVAAGATGANRLGRDDDRDRDPPPNVGFVGGDAAALIRRATNSPNDFGKFLGTGRSKHGAGRGVTDGGIDDIPGNRRGIEQGEGPSRQGTIETENPGRGRERCKAGPGKCGPPTTVAKTDEVILDTPPTIGVDGDDIDPRKIAAAINSRKGLFRGCFQIYLDRHGGTGGTVKLRFTIEPDGTVKTVTTESSTVPDGELKACVERSVKRITTFPQSKHGAVVRYPFGFHGGG